MSNRTGLGSALPATGIEEAYERFAPLAEKYCGPDLHNGYWYDSEDDSSLENASRRLTEFVTDKLGVGPGDRVLDLGCGNGRPAVSAGIRTGADVTGIDVNRRALREAATHASASGVSHYVSFEYADALNPPFRPGTFDAAMSLESSQYFELAELLPSMARLLRPGGRLVLEAPFTRVPASERLRHRTAEYYELIQAVSLDTLQRHVELANAAGLSPVEFVDITENTMPTWPRVLRRLRDGWDEIERVLGAELAERAIATFSAWHELPEVGIMILTLRRDEVLFPN
ncbi:27-O-demethylrifamycin SV methyltransferase [Actinopolyspora xinjiangensis]|uniref:27-O-demethylrifamycin SV methyltransferase n=1 Tax=Actinopolyspora xinjiangensis TaxID=405564 RepID=A0A1H0VVB7_9ACTN|nr:methyltransferase domain-containing protein [Actinopolyspora xinjiangensis]SDP82095.1 27-O-demethylrifamycin SV methyltransferase [Actinopolyspora xinjiangensis]